MIPVQTTKGGSKASLCYSILDFNTIVVTIQLSYIRGCVAHGKGVCRPDGDSQAPGMGSCVPWNG